MLNTDMSDVPYESLPLVTYKTDATAHAYTKCVHPLAKYQADTANGLLYGGIGDIVLQYFPQQYRLEERESEDATHMFVFRHNNFAQEYVRFLMQNKMISYAPQYNAYETGVDFYYDFSLLFKSQADRDTFVANLGAFSNNVQ